MTLTYYSLAIPWIIGWIITGGFAAISILALLGFWLHETIVKTANKGKAYYAYTEPWAWISGIAGVLAILIGIIQALMMIPYDVKYWSWYTTSGTVSEITNRTLDVTDDDITQQFIVHLAGVETPFYMTDPRITSLEGKDVTLLCGVSWVDFGHAADRWRCDIKDAPYVRTQP